MSDTDETQLDVQRREYQWKCWYSRFDEYDKNPPWTRTMSLNHGTEASTMYDTADAETAWITSETVYDLVRAR